jgi:UDP-N-acetylmuramate: L-alanyl-gamma-D-glutamyl-meso-diaminopimelate ligase
MIALRAALTDYNSRRRKNMHIHILGIAGTFMGGLALIARAAGHRVTGCDTGIYPPMSTQLQEQGIEFIDGFEADQLALKPDLFIVGNVVKRGTPIMEAILNAGLPYTSGPQWLGQHILHGSHVAAVAGTHGKTTTSSMLAWILQYAGHKPNFLIGGIAPDLGVSARYEPNAGPFVIEADEYDTAFFDKRSKFVHYRPRTAILNNLEYDHADIFPDLAAIETQFHHLVRTIPANGLIIRPHNSDALNRVLARGCWTPVTTFGRQGQWHTRAGTDDSFQVWHHDTCMGSVNWALGGEHNRNNALAALAAASHLGVDARDGVEALSNFGGVKRRMELRGQVNNIKVYDDFAHHPTAIATTLEGARRSHKAGRLLALLEPRSNTMKLGTMAAQLPGALACADKVFCYGEKQGSQALGWDPARVLAPLGERASTFTDIDTMVKAVVQNAQPGDTIVVMSNGSFGGIHQKLLDALGIL